METRQHKRISLAQNFLTSPKLARRLVGMSKIGPCDFVYEIGPGNGIITAVLASVEKQVIAIEKDPELVRRLRERYHRAHWTGTIDHVRDVRARVAPHDSVQRFVVRVSWEYGRDALPRLSVGQPPGSEVLRAVRHTTRARVRRPHGPHAWW